MTEDKYGPLVWASLGAPSSQTLSDDQWEKISECFPARLRGENGEPGETIERAMRSVIAAVATYQSFAKLPDDEWKVGSANALRKELSEFAKSTRSYADAITRLSERARDAVSSSIDTPGREPDIETARIARLTAPKESRVDADRVAREKLRDLFDDLRTALPDLAFVSEVAADRIKSDRPGSDTKTQSPRYLAQRLARIWHTTTKQVPAFSSTPAPESYCALVATVFEVAGIENNPQSVARYVLENEFVPS